MDAGKANPSDFRLSQALSYWVAQKGFSAATANPSLSTPTFLLFNWSASIPIETV